VVGADGGEAEKSLRKTIDSLSDGGKFFAVI